MTRWTARWRRRSWRSGSRNWVARRSRSRCRCRSTSILAGAGAMPNIRGRSSPGPHLHPNSRPNPRPSQSPNPNPSRNRNPSPNRSPSPSRSLRNRPRKHRRHRHARRKIPLRRRRSRRLRRWRSSSPGSPRTAGRSPSKSPYLPDGTLVKDSSACVMTHGTAERVKVIGVDALGALIEDLTPSQAIALGTLSTDLPDRVEVTTKQRLVNGVARPDVIARTGSNIIYHGPAFALLDYDSKGMPTAVAAELERAGGFWDALLTVLPALKDTAHVMRRSTSAGLSRADTGETLPGSDGVHVYVAVKDGADSERFLRALHDRCWLAGLGWMMVSSSGALLERSIVDRMVGGPERLVFEGGPVLAPPLQQDKESRRSIAVDGNALDTTAVCPSLLIIEQARLDELKARERERLAPEMAEARAAFVEAQARKLVTRTGMSEKAARQVIIRQCEGVLRPDVELPFDDPELAGRTVGDVLANPELYEGETLADPLEGVSYGVCKAKVMLRDDGTPWIHSFAHGRTIYKLKHDVVSVRKAVEEAAPKDVVATLARLAAGADLDAVELEQLRQRAHELSGVKLRTISSALKTAQQQQATQDAKAQRAREAA